jgi:hypothetical protein
MPRALSQGTQQGLITFPANLQLSRTFRALSCQEFSAYRRKSEAVFIQPVCVQYSEIVILTSFDFNSSEGCVEFMLFARCEGGG